MKEMMNEKANPEAAAFISNPPLTLKLKFLIPSFIGVLLFLCPVFIDGEMNLLIGIIANYVIDLVAPISNILTMSIVCLSGLATLVFTVAKPKFISDNPFLSSLFIVKPIFVFIRFLGAIFSIMVVCQLGLSFVYSPNTGGTMFSLMASMISWLSICALLIPLLLDYGIMDFIGVLIRGLLQPLFRLPGRASLDLVASWIGNGTVGVLITTQQYEKGYYTAREAIQIATLFSAVSIPFCLMIAGVLNVANYFIPMYLIMCTTGVLTAFVMSHIWPFKGKFKDEYYSPVGKQVHEIAPQNISKLKWGYRQALLRASAAPGIKGVLTAGGKSVLNIILTLIPAVVAIGTLGLIINEYTPIFEIISTPFRYIFQWLGIEEAAAAAPGAVVGFIDMYIPAVLCAGIQSLSTRFFMCCLSLVQIIYISEIGACILGSKLPVKLWDLLVIFLIKTVLAIPVIWILMKLFMPF